MQNFVLSELTPPVAIICHDAGAANIIFAWLNAAEQAWSDYRVFVQGPAQKILAHSNLAKIAQVTCMEDALHNANTLLAGTGWASTLEFDAVHYATTHGIKAISVIDHWTNYQARFIRDNIQVLPNEIWVTDEYAHNIAEQTFPSLVVKSKPNLYLSNLVSQVIVKSKQQPQHNAVNILYLLEPIRTTWRIDGPLGEFDALAYFFTHLAQLHLGKISSIKLRPHPSDPPEKYQQIRDAYAYLPIEIDHETQLEDAIAWADVVVGCQTFAMVIAEQAGKRVLSSMPPWAPPCILPHSGIVKMADLLNLTQC